MVTRDARADSRKCEDSNLVPTLDCVPYPISLRRRMVTAFPLSPYRQRSTAEPRHSGSRHLRSPDKVHVRTRTPCSRRADVDTGTVAAERNVDGRLSTAATRGSTEM